MSEYLTAQAIRTLKGAPLSVLCLLLITPQPVTQEYCQRFTGYTDKPIYQALQLLEEIGYISRNSRNAWQLMPGAAQLPFIIPDGLVTDSESTRNNSESISTTTTAFTANGRTKKDAAAAANDSELFRVNLAALKAAGIMGKKAETLAGLPHMNPEYIQAHTAYAFKRGDKIGLLITRLQDGDPAPEPEPDPDEKYRRYATPEEGGPEDDPTEDEPPAISTEDARLWDHVLGELRREMSAGMFGTWVESLDPLGFDCAGGEIFRVRAHNSYARDWVKSHVEPIIARLLSGLAGRVVEFDVVL